MATTALSHALNASVTDALRHHQQAGRAEFLRPRFRTGKVPSTFPGNTPGSDLFDLTIFQLNGRRTAKDRHFDLEARALFVHFLDHARKARERAVGDADVFADLEADGRLGPIHA